MMKILAKKLNIVFFFTFAFFAIVSFGFATQVHADWSYDGGDYYDGSGSSNWDYADNTVYYPNDYYLPSDTCYDCNSSGYYYYDTSSYDTCYDCNSTPYYSYDYSYDTCRSGCNNNNYNYIPPVPTIPPVVVSCTPSTSNSQNGQSVTWYAYVSGGNGNYSYSWSGTDGLSGGGNSQSRSYSSSGTKNAHVTVTSGDKSASADCSTYVNDNYQNFDVSCSIDDYYVNVGDQVRMNASASGGNGNYSYTWYGSSPLDGRTGSSQYVTYDSIGDKDVRVTAYSNGQERTRSCGTVHVGNNYNSGYNYNYYNNNNLNISCTVNSANVAVGQNVVWNTSVTGGNGNYNYSWTGTDSLYGNSSTISRSYSTTGTKSSTVTVTSNGQTKSLTCPIVNVGGGVALYTGPSQGNLASLSSVYLNQVPYTGVGDNPKLMMFVIGLILWSGAMAYAIIYRQSKSARKNAILDFKKENMAKRGLV